MTFSATVRPTEAQSRDGGCRPPDHSALMDTHSPKRIEHPCTLAAYPPHNSPAAVIVTVAVVHRMAQSPRVIGPSCSSARYLQPGAYNWL